MSVGTFGERMRRHRRKLGWNQRELAQRVGCAPQHINDLEHDRRQPAPTMLTTEICLALGMEVDVVWFRMGRIPLDLVDLDVSDARIVASLRELRMTLTSDEEETS